MEHNLIAAEGHILAAQTTVAAMRAARRGDVDEAVRLRAAARRVRENARWFSEHAKEVV